jgi:membrane-associated phospholipid phosphatase
VTVLAPRITRANVGRALALGYLAFSLLYLGAAAMPLGARVRLEPSPLDAAIPFVGWTIWLYVTQFALLPGAIVLARDEDRSQTFYSVLLAAAIAALIFVLRPTMIERPAVPQDGLTGFAWQLVYTFDTNGNCLPSLHVAFASLAAIALWLRGWRIVALGWPGLISASTLTTKQHFAWDVAAGLALAVAAWTLTPKLVRHERTQPTGHAANA